MTSTNKEILNAMGLGTWEIILIIVAIVLVFGAKRIPEIARALGRAKNEFDKAKSEIEKEGEDLTKENRKDAGKKDE